MFTNEEVSALREMLAGPGMDTRQWVSNGTVVQDTPDARSVVFKDTEGNPLSNGVLVVVKLHPSATIVACRLAGGCAGDGEGEYMPFVAGDEVVVVIPEGDERAGPMIIGRLNQKYDIFPHTVAGQDVTANTFGFRRIRCPYILETASSYMIRSAVTGANLTIDQTGNIFLASGDGHLLLLNADAVKLGIGNADVPAYLQFDPSTSQASLAAEQLTVSLTGHVPCYHLLTVEAFINVLSVVLAGFLVPPVPALATPSAVATTQTLIAAMLPACVLPTSVLTPVALQAITAAFALQSLPTSPYGALAAVDGVVPATAGAFPGIGRPNFLVG